MRKIYVIIAALFVSVSSHASTTVCTAMCHVSWSTFGYQESGNQFISVIGKGANEASAAADLQAKCQAYNRNATAVLGLKTSNSRDSDYVSVSSIRAGSFSCIEL